MSLKQTDSEVAKYIAQELDRQEYGLEMIASENYVSKEVLEAQGSVLTNKYAEGYPRKRYYGGCEFVDEVEQLAIDRAKQLFLAEHVNVQPHSGSQANMAVYLAAAQPGSKVLGMDLSHGGHLTHGSPVNFSGFLYNPVHYGLDPETHQLNYNQIADLAKEHKPQIIIAGYSAYPRTLDFKAFREIADSVGAVLMADIAHIAGIVAAGEHQSPIPYADYTTTTTHKTLRGPRGGMILTREDLGKGVNSKIFPGIQGGPLEHVIAAKAVAFGEALKPEFKTYIKQVLVNAKVLAEVLVERGFHLVTGGTENHLILLDLSTRDDLTGKEGEIALDTAGITVNKNTVPNEKRSPFVTSGLRIGTPALTTRGMKEAEIKIVAHWIADVLNDHTNEDLQKMYDIKLKNFVSNFRSIHKRGLILTLFFVMTACSGLRSTQGVYKSSSGYSGMGEFSGPGSLSQPEYEGPMPAPEDDGDPRNYVTPKGLPAPSGPFTLTPPVQRMRITQRFANPKNPRHQGIDIGGRIGTPIYAAHEGVIVYAGTGFKGYGRLIIIEFDKTWASLYAHMSVLRMKTGDTVRPGQEIGLMGKSGRVTGVHLHFELLKNKQPVDPLEYFSTSVAL